ncbi:MAG: biotin synthase BioB [Bacillota bacterium]
MITELKDRVLSGGEITPEEAKSLFELGEGQLMSLLAAANEIKEHYQGKKVDLCSIVSAKAGNCSEDCAFCAQSAHHDTEAVTYPLLDETEILKRAKEVEAEGAEHFGLVTSGRGVIDDQEFEQIIKIIERIKEETSLEPCASLGTLDEARADRLAEVGLKRFNHNLETSASHFAKICTTHTYKERMKTVKLLKDRDVEVCSGGIIGLGESYEDRIELAFTLKELGVDSVPINILNAVEGTPLADEPAAQPMEALQTAAIFRFILPTKVIKLCGGREKNLGDLQSLSLLSGINGLLVGNYLTTDGRAIAEDIAMIEDLGLES